MIKYYIVIIFLMLLYSCSNDIEEVNSLMSKEEIKIETARDIEIIYSDSAQIKLVLQAPILKRHLDRRAPYEEFDQGIEAEFFGVNKQPNAWLESKYAVRKEKENIIIVRDSVVLINRRNEKLETSELIWNEKDQTASTNKFVMISQPEKGDTSYGYGFESNSDFTRFEIKNRFSSKMTSSDYMKNLGKNSESTAEKKTDSNSSIINTKKNKRK